MTPFWYQKGHFQVFCDFQTAKTGYYGLKMGQKHVFEPRNRYRSIFGENEDSPMLSQDGPFSLGGGGVWGNPPSPLVLESSKDACRATAQRGAECGACGRSAWADGGQAPTESARRSRWCCRAHASGCWTPVAGGPRGCRRRWGGPGDQGGDMLSTSVKRNSTVDGGQPTAVGG